MIIELLLRRATDLLKEKSIVTARLDSELLLSHLLNVDKIYLIINSKNEIEKKIENEFFDLVERRQRGEPVAYLLGIKEFYNYIFKVNKNVLIPRPESELIIDEAIDWLKKYSDLNVSSILDLGCGSGCLGLTLAKLNTHIEVDLVDLSKEALLVAKENAEKLNIINCNFHHSDAVKFKSNKRYSIIVANPPYLANKDSGVDISVHNFEPHMALYSGDTGLEAYENWIINIKNLIRSPGIIIFEIGNTQAEAVSKILKYHLPTCAIKVCKDLAGHDRMVCATL